MRILLVTIFFLTLLSNAFGAGCYDDIEASFANKFEYRNDGQTLFFLDLKNKNRKKDIIVYRIGLLSKDNVIMRESNVEVEVPAKKVQKFGLNISPKKFNIKLSDAGESYWFCKYAVKDDKKKNINKKKSFDSKGILKKLLGKN